MSRNLTILLPFLLLAAGAAGAQFSPSLLPNGDFAGGLTGWSASVNDAKKLGAAVTVDPTPAAPAGPCLRLTLPGGPTAAAAGSPPAPVSGGQLYLVTFHFRSEGFSDTDLFAGVNLQYNLAWLDADKKQVGGSGGGLTYGAVPDWRFICALCRAPARAAWLALSFAMSSDEKGRASSAWFDRVQVRPWPELPSPSGKTWVYPVSEGIFDATRFRRVADDDTPSGFAVIANPKFTTTPGNLIGGLYLRTLPPGAYRAIFRLKIGALPAAPQALFSWDLNTGFAGQLNRGVFSTADFTQAGVYQDFIERFVLPPPIPGKDNFVDPRVYWNGGVTAWADPVTIVQEKVFTAEDLRALLDQP